MCWTEERACRSTGGGRESKRQGVTAEVLSVCKRNVMSWTRANSSSSRSTLVPVRGLAGERTSSWYIIDQRLICQGFENLLKERLWDNQRELRMGGDEAKGVKEVRMTGRRRTLGV